MIDDSQIQNRHDPAGHYSRRDCRLSFGPFCDELRRARLTPTLRDLALLIASDTLRSGFLSVIYGRLENLVLDEPGQPPVLKLDRNDISPALKALDRLGIVRADRVRFERDTVWLVLVFPNSAQWRMGPQDWRFLPDRLHRRQMHLNAQRRRAARYLAGLAPDIDLYDALAAEAVGTCPASGSDALNESGQTASGRNSLSFCKSDALTVSPPRKTAAVIVPRSENQNAKMPANDEKALGVPKFRTGLTVDPEQEPVTETVQQLNRFASGVRQNELLAMLVEQFERAHGVDDTAREMSRSGGFWRKVAKHFPGHLLGSIGQLKIKLDARETFFRGAWFWMMDDLLRFIGAKSWDEAWQLKKPKESFSTK